MSDVHPQHRYHERALLHVEAEREAWREYLRTTRSCRGALYTQSEPLAWRRLRRRLAEVAHERRRDDFERDRALAELPMERRAA